MRIPFVTIVSGAATLLGGCANPPYVDNCPADRPTEGTACTDTRSSCSYSAPGCEGSTSALVRATCTDGKWKFQSYGVSCNPPNPMPDSGVDAGTCPAQEPAIGSACTGTVCTYQNLCPLISIEKNTYRCIGGKWSFENSLESPIECPKTAPKNGEACGCAMYLPATCSYAGACGSDSAKCDGATQRWIATPGVCDAGAD
jgi:hypothetical protein